MSGQFTSAERELQKAFGKQATFRTYHGEETPITVMERNRHSETRGGDFRQRGTLFVFDVVFSDVPTDWRDGSVILNGRQLNVIDLIPDASGELAEIRCE